MGRAICYDAINRRLFRDGYVGSNCRAKKVDKVRIKRLYDGEKMYKQSSTQQNNVLRKQKAHVLPKHCCAKGKIVDATVQQHTAPPLTAVRGGGCCGETKTQT